MAETWRARLRGAAGVTKSVLIKKVLPEYANDEAFVSMFISEARISATLSHGAIAQVFDFGKVDGQYFLAMELVEGQPLNRIMKRALRSGFHSLPVPIAVFIAMEMCRGLHYAHTRGDEKGEPLGIVHRDISPDNVLIGYEGQVKIVDFGIAKARSLRSFNTEPGVVKGKYLFFSPEQARGEAVDARTDVWATGVVLFQMLCGRLPLEGQVHTVLQRLNSGQPLPSARQVRSDIPVALDAILQRALALRKDSRFASAHALGDALAGFLYSSTPRFSPMSVAYLLRELFRPDLEALGLDARVPAAFAEEVSIWREAPPLPAPTQHGVPALDLEPDSHTEERGPVEVGDADQEAPAPRVTRVGLFAEGSRSSQWVAGVGLVVAAVLAVVAVTRVGSDL
ncbi:serine/threonine-protein kinase, partial [Myxococcus vastator]|uniref:serine/threonine-protein kinase n=1 Tax=Myxococcus vastator TaxID=2709664 RepID=UPI001F07DDB1